MVESQVILPSNIAFPMSLLSNLFACTVENIRGLSESNILADAATRKHCAAVVSSSDARRDMNHPIWCSKNKFVFSSWKSLQKDPATTRSVCT